MNIEDIKKTALVFDLETSSHYHDGKEINIQTNFEDYIQYAKIKWFGAYSYLHNKEYYLNMGSQRDFGKALDLLQEHKVLIGFNSEEFDYPILFNNGFIDVDKKYLQVDCMQIYGTAKFKNKQGFKYKNRGELMDYKFRNNSLKCMAETMKLDYQKGTIDYRIFFQDIWSEDQTTEIIKYLQCDVLALKNMFEKLWDYWQPFVNLLEPKDVYNLSWIKSSIASLTYKAACKVMGVEPTYAEKKSEAEEMGGNVIDPKVQEAWGSWYVDFGSLYPHIFSMFNLPYEIDKDSNIASTYGWHGNEVFKVKGWYYSQKWHPLSKYISEKLKERIHLKETDKTNPMIYTLKIFLNGLYGIFRSALFEKIHTPNCGWDCCWLGQQIQQLTVDMMQEFGFETLYGDTDSWIGRTNDKEKNTKEYVTKCLNKIVEKIKANAPFPVDTFKLNIEHYMEYIMFPFSEHAVVDEATGKNKKIKNRLVKEYKGKKKNYLYTYKENGELKVQIIGFPLIKENATDLGMKIYEEVLKPQILKNNSAKFDREFIEAKIDDYLKRPEIMELIAVEWKVQKAESYKNQSSIYAQISQHYFGGKEGTVKLIKNNTYGTVGKGQKYCTLIESQAVGLTSKELDLDKIWQELGPFIKIITNELVEKEAIHDYQT